jgi:hypothetical protein
MKWNIEYSRDADRFIDKQDIRVYDSAMSPTFHETKRF